MHLLLTAIGPDNVPHDLAVECEESATVDEVTSFLAERVGAPAHIGATRGRLYLGSHVLDPRQKVAASPLRHGVVVGLDRPVPRIEDEPPGTLELRITSGTGAGTTYRLSPGSWSVGTGAYDAVRLEDPLVHGTAVTLDIGPDGTVGVTPEPAIVGATRPVPPRRRPHDGPVLIPVPPTKEYARSRQGKKEQKQDLLIGLDATHTEVDPSLPIPLVHVERIPVTGRTHLPLGHALTIGNTMLEVSWVTPPDASLTYTPTGSTLDFNRPPRMLPPERPTKFVYPREPKKPEGVRFPWPMVVAPIVMGLVMFLVFDRWYMLLFVLLSPLMYIGNMLQQNSGTAKRFRRDLGRYRERRRKIQGDAFRALTEESAARRRDYMDPANVLLTATGPRARLWERRPTDPDWLHLRVGTADTLSEITINDPEREKHEEDLIWTAPDVPIVVELPEFRVLGLAGPTAHRRAVARWMLAQLSVLHSPGEVDIRLISDRADDEAWGWVRWLPHVRAGRDEDGIARVGTDEQSTARQFAAIAGIIDSRGEELKAAGGFMRSGRTGFPPVVVFLEDAARLRLLPGAVGLLQAGPAVDVYFVCMDDDVRLLPEECQAVVSSDGYWLTVEKTGKETADSVRPDLVSRAWCERVARALAPLRDVSLEDASGAIPAHSRLLDVLRLDPPVADRILAGWSGRPRTTAAVIGEGLDGPFTLDISRDGPHGLVAGTTGSGKSELLQTIIASLAVGNRPDEFNFVLIDYKGGSAFKDCNNLPHTVGMVSDLDGHLTTRALASLAAELHRRERMLARAGAKDIEDFTAQREAGTNPTDEPMPRLLIVIDEFAALVSELPDFVKGLVDIARRGRSLGVHLILATQRPSGVVSAEIKSNTNLRIALRVTDANDSQDVIEASDAAEIPKSLPGRAFARLGHSALHQFQSARVGGRPRNVEAGPEVEVSRLAWSTLAAPAEVREEGDEDITVPTDLASLVGVINEAASAAGISSPPPPWLPPLEDVVTIDDLYTFVPRERVRSELVLPLGLVDLPHDQSRTALTYDLAHDTNVLVVSMPRMGRSSILRGVAGVIADNLPVTDVHIYGIDCGNNALLPLQALPHVGAVVTRDQPERLGRLTTKLREEITRRQEQLAASGFADITEQRRAVATEDRLPYIVVLFDRWEAFNAAFSNVDMGALVDAWQQIIQESSSVGIRIFMTGDRSCLVGRMSTLIDDKFLMRMADASDFTNIGMNVKEVPNHLPPGRAFRSGSTAESQFALLTADPDGTAQVRALQEIGRAAAARIGELPAAKKPFRVDDLPTRITVPEMLALGGARSDDTSYVPLGVGGDTLTMKHLSITEDGPTFMILGPRKSGRSNVLRLVAGHLVDADYSLLLVIPRRSPLAEFATDPHVVRTLTPETDRDEGKEVFEQFAELTKDRTKRTAVLIDDLELLGLDGWLVDGIEQQVKLVRDSESFVMAAGTADDLGSSYRGPAVALKKSRSGLLLRPQQPNDGDMFGARLPRSIGSGSGNTGRALLFRSGQWERIQVPLVEG